MIFLETFFKCFENLYDVLCIKNKIKYMKIIIKVEENKNKVIFGKY